MLNTARHFTFWLTCFLLGLGLLPAAYAQPSWQLVVHDDLRVPTLSNFAQRNALVFDYFLDQSLHGAGHEAFINVSKRVKNNIAWTGKQGNRYNKAFRRSYPVIKNYDHYAIPEIVFLIPYMESLWRSKGGKPTADYGYWQLVPEVVAEIQTLDYVPDSIKNSHLDTIRSDPDLSTQAALIHLKRYHFYFAKVAKFSETDAWLFTMQAYNWGAGNVKRMLQAMQEANVQQDFGNFYYYLYQQHRKNPDDVSLRAAAEYLPNLYHIAQVIKNSNQ